nr:hypothetical protein [uncultured Methanoregula sp.]
MSNDIPLLKEYRVDKIIQYLTCIDKYHLNRLGQKNCIYQLFRQDYDKPIESFDKAIFRGMVIPTLNYLGFLTGSGEFIKVSANGKLIVESNIINKNLNEQVLMVLMYELDESIFHFISNIEKTSKFNQEEFSDEFFLDLPNISKKQRSERINKWILILSQVNLINISKQNEVVLNQDNIEKVKKMLDPRTFPLNIFEKILLESYVKMSGNRARIVEIEELRAIVSVNLLQNNNFILTEKMFDVLLTKIMQNPGRKIFSLGKPMGRQEKLFKFKENYFKTLNIEKDEG